MKISQLTKKGTASGATTSRTGNGVRAAMPATPPASRYDSGVRYDSGARYADDPPASATLDETKVKLELRERSDADLLQFASQHITAMTGNANFPSPLPLAATFLAAVEFFAAKLTVHDNASAAAREATAAKDQARRALQALFVQRGDYVNIASNGNEAVILSAALPVRRTRTPVGVLPPPQNLRVELNGVAGEMHLKWDVVPYSDGYAVECAEVSATGPRVWGLVKTVTKARLNLNDMPVGTTYAFRVATVGGSTGQSAWTPEVMRMAA